MLLTVLLVGTVAEGASAAASAADRASPSRVGPTVAARAEPCATTATRPFRPRKIRFVGETPKLTVVRTPRRKGVVGSPPVTTKGKRQVGWDPHGRPASGVGTVILTAHTWPDGTALGNKLLRRLHRGDRFVLTAGGKAVCYRVTKRAAYKAKKVPRHKAFRYWGEEQAVIVACSGRRLGPGRWTKRTVWYAKPVPRKE